MEKQSELVVRAEVANIEAITEFVNERLDAMGCPVKARTQIDVALDEILSNVAFYAYGEGSGDLIARVVQEDSPPGVSIYVLDRGMPFNPLAMEDPDITLSAEERGIGGLGLFMVKKMMDVVEYQYAEGMNRLHFRKNF